MPFKWALRYSNLPDVPITGDTVDAVDDDPSVFDGFTQPVAFVNKSSGQEIRPRVFNRRISRWAVYCRRGILKGMASTLSVAMKLADLVRRP